VAIYFTDVSGQPVGSIFYFFFFFGFLVPHEDVTDSICRNVCKKLTTTCCVRTQNSAVLSYFKAGAQNDALFVALSEPSCDRFWNYVKETLLLQWAWLAMGRKTEDGR
jgi:hypothetical protein